MLQPHCHTEPGRVRLPPAPVDDKELARRAQQATLAIDARSANLEAVCYNLIATQSPVASDFRLLQTIIYVNFNLQRMSDKVRRIARAAKRKVNNDIELPAELVDLIQRESECVYRVLGASASALVNNDLAAMADLAQRDDEVHEVYERFFRTYNRMDAEELADDASLDDLRRVIMVSRYLDRIAAISIDAAFRIAFLLTYNRMDAEELADDASLDDLRRVIMVSRYLDRIAAISIDAAFRIAFLLTGQRWSVADLIETDEGELESMRIPSGEGVTLDPVRDARAVASLAPDEVGGKLASLIREVESEDGGE